MEQKNSKIYLLMIMGAVFWAGAFIAGKYSVGQFSPTVVTFLRFLFASIIIFVVMVKKEKADWKLRKAQDWGVMLILGIVGMIGYHILFFTALKYTRASNASMLAATNPLLTAFLASVFAGERLGLKRLGVVLLALLGVILTISNWDIEILLNLSFNRGDIIMLVAVACWSVYSILVKIFMPRYTPLILTTYSFIVCTVILAPFVLFEGIFEQMAKASWQGWLAVIYMSVFPTVIGYLIQQIAIREIGPSKTSIFINLVPVFSIGLAWIVLGENITLLNILSAFIIVVAVYLNSKIKIVFKGEINIPQSPNVVSPVVEGN